MIHVMSLTVFQVRLIKHDLQCINALDVLRALKDGLDQHPSITKEERERYLNFISIARKEYDEFGQEGNSESVCVLL